MQFKDLITTEDGVKVLIHRVKPISNLGKSRLKSNWKNKVKKRFDPRKGKSLILPFNINSRKKLINWISKTLGDGSYKINPYVKNKKSKYFKSCLGKFLVRITIVRTNEGIDVFDFDDTPIKKINWYKS